MLSFERFGRNAGRWCRAADPSSKGGVLGNCEQTRCSCSNSFQEKSCTMLQE
jgi:hypothetical protein